jgi:hypothetical protein
VPRSRRTPATSAVAPKAKRARRNALMTMPPCCRAGPNGTPQDHSGWSGGTNRGESNRARTCGLVTKAGSPSGGSGDHPPMRRLPPSTSIVTPVIWAASSEKQKHRSIGDVGCLDHPPEDQVPAGCAPAVGLPQAAGSVGLGQAGSDTVIEPATAITSTPASPSSFSASCNGASDRPLITTEAPSRPSRAAHARPMLGLADEP